MAHGDGSAAMAAPFDPVVPCRVMETRPCVNLPDGDPADAAAVAEYIATEATRYRDVDDGTCLGPCARYER